MSGGPTGRAQSLRGVSEPSVKLKQSVQVGDVRSLPRSGATRALPRKVLTKVDRAPTGAQQMQQITCFVVVSPLPGLSRLSFNIPTAYAVGSGSFAPPALFGADVDPARGDRPVITATVAPALFGTDVDPGRGGRP